MQNGHARMASGRAFQAKPASAGAGAATDVFQNRQTLTHFSRFGQLGLFGLWPLHRKVETSMEISRSAFSSVMRFKYYFFASHIM